MREGMNRVQKTAVRVLLWVLTLGMCVLIFGFSAQDGDTSMETSGMIAKNSVSTISTAEMTPLAFFSLTRETCPLFPVTVVKDFRFPVKRWLIPRISVPSRMERNAMI